MGRSGTMTVLFSDIVGSTELLTRLGERTWDDVRRRHFTVLRSALAEHDGTEVKNTGDGIMAVFGSAVDGVNCAVSMQQLARSVEAGGRPVQIRIGLSTGEALSDRGDWFGIPVVEAARLCALADPSESWATGLVQALAGSQSDAQFVSLGDRSLKGFDQQVDVFALQPRDGYQGSAYAQVDLHGQLGERLVSALDFWESLPELQRVRGEASAALAPLPGDVICDIGCRTGTELIRIARILGPGGVAIGVDPSPTMLDECRTRAAAEDVPIELIERDCRDTGLPTAHCDGVRMERVLQHVGDLDGLLLEATRITRPGGRIVIVDSDWGSLMAHPGDRDLLRRIKSAFETEVLPEPWAGRLLHEAVLDHGLTDVECKILPVQAGPGIIPSMTGMYQRFVNARVLSQTEMDDHLAEIQAAFERGTALFAFCMFVVSGRVPEG